MQKLSPFYFILWLGLVFACGSLGTDVISPALPLMAPHFSTSDFHIQLLMSAYIVGVAIAQLLFGPLSDRFGRKPVLRWGLCLFAATSVMCSLASSIQMLIILRFFQGIAASSGLVIARAVTRDCFSGKDKLGYVMSRLSLTLSLSPVVLPPLGGWLAATFSWQANFLFLGGLILLLVLVAEIGYRETLAQINPTALHPKELTTNILSILKHPAFTSYMITGSLCFAGLFAFISNGPFVFKNQFQLSPTNTGLILGLAFAAHSLGIFLVGQLVNKLGSCRLISAGTFLCLVSGIALAGMDYLSVGNVFSFSIGMATYLFGAGLVYPLTLAGALHPFFAIAGTASAMMGFCVMLISGLTSMLVGTFYEDSPASLSIFVAIVGALSFVSFITLERYRVAWIDSSAN